MIKASISNLIGVGVDESYPWKETLFINSGIATFYPEDYEKCKAYIYINKCKVIETMDCRDIGEGIYIGNNIFVDLKYGIRLERNDISNITLNVSQECNEWLVICIQLLLIELNCTLIHGAALEKNGEVILLPSWGGVGKTATVMRMVRDNGWRLLGDDLVILRDNDILPFLKPFVIYPYHKSLFPEIFNENKGRVVTNLKVNKLMSKIIPVAKRTMRLIPGLLAFARKHNPQSMRISPNAIFAKEQLSCGGQLKKVVWLERIVDKKVSYSEKNIEYIASKTVSVSMMELFSDRISCVFALCGTGIFDYQNIYIKMYNLILSVYKNKVCYELDIPTFIPIDEVGNVVLKHITNSHISTDTQDKVDEYIEGNAQLRDKI